MTQPITHKNKKLVKIDFDQFKKHNSNQREAFESLCYFLFCRKFKITSGIFRYKNQTGIETNPIKRGKEVIGFQSKFFDNAIDTKQLIPGLQAAKSKHPKLNKVIYYVNKEFSESSGRTVLISQKQKDVESAAKKLRIKIEWVVPSNFEIILNKPSNLDLAQIYFGEANELEFIKNNTDYRIQTFLQSSEYIELPLSIDGKNVKKPAQSILRTKQKNFLIIGHPGSGKSFLAHALFRVFAGLDKKTSHGMIQSLIKKGAIPMLINLKDCVNESLENLIHIRQKDSNIKGHTLGFIYVFDGLDELNEEKADQTLSYINNLEQQESTKKIIISCRSGNSNRIKAQAYFPKIIELKFFDLDLSFVNKFFSVKNNPQKVVALNKLLKFNTKIVNEIKDILLIRLLWETIETIGPNSTVADLIEAKINLLLKNPDHKKNIDGLNLLDAKCDALIALNQEISFVFQQKFQYRFPQKELQEIIMRKFPRIDYKSTNELLNYLSNLFFDSSSSDADPGPGFIYQHRRYQEFFFTQRLKTEYESDPKILRKLDILSNRDFFEDYFMPYVRKEYEHAENVIGLLDLNLLDLYLGNHGGYGVDDAYYMNSSEFIPAIANQNIFLIEELIESENFQVKKILFVDMDILKDRFKKWNENKEDIKAKDHLSSIWSVGVSSLLEHSVIFWKSGKKDIAKRLLTNLREVQSIYKENKYFELVDKEHRPNDPFWKQWKDYLYLLISIKNENISNIFTDLVRKNYDHFPDNKEDERIYQKGEGKEKLVKSFFNVVLDHSPKDLLKIIDDFDEYEFVAFLEVLSSYDFLHILIENDSFQSKIKSILISKNILVSEDRYFIAFYKSYLAIDLSDSENELLKELIKKLRNERKVDWRFHDVSTKFSLVSFALKINDFSALKVEPGDHFRYYDEQALYAALFHSFVQILDKKQTIAQAIRDYLEYVSTHDDRLGQYLKVDTSFLWAYIFSASGANANIDLSGLKYRILQDGSNVIPWSFYFRLSLINKKLFDKIVNESDLTVFEGNLEKAEDYQSLVNECFALAIFYSSINDQKSKRYFIRGLKDSILRHGWRKDSLVSHQLVTMLEILWKNNWDTKENLVKLTNEVFDLTLRVGEFTDGAVTWHGPYNVIELASKYDLSLADLLKRKLIDKSGHSNYNNIVITTFLLGKVRLGLSIEDIEKGMEEFRVDYDYEGKPNSSSYDEKFKVYVSIADSDLYREEERTAAFNKAYDLVEEMKREGVSYYLRDTDFKEIKTSFVALCSKYGKDVNIEFDKKEDYSEKSKFSHEEVLKMIKSLDTKAKVRNFYKKLENYKLGIIFDKKETWDLLLNQTYKVVKNINYFIKLLERFSFPHTDWFTSNSKYFHIGVATALADINMKPEMIKHLYKNTGHGGFNNMAKAYELIGDKLMCKKLFERYLQLCHFLSD